MELGGENGGSSFCSTGQCRVLRMQKFMFCYFGSPSSLQDWARTRELICCFTILYISLILQVPTQNLPVSAFEKEASSSLTAKWEIIFTWHRFPFHCLFNNNNNNNNNKSYIAPFHILELLSALDTTTSIKKCPQACRPVHHSEIAVLNYCMLFLVYCTLSSWFSWL